MSRRMRWMTPLVLGLGISLGYAAAATDWSLLSKARAASPPADVESRNLLLL